MTQPLSLDGLHGRAVIRIEEAAQLLGVGRSTAYEAARTGQLPTLRVGRRLVVPVAQFLAWLGTFPPPAPHGD